MSFVRIWLHGVWGTKNREPLLEEGIHDDICEHIKENAAKNKVFIDSIDGGKEHLHSLMTLGPDMTVSRQMQLIKGESSHWINKNELTKRHFEWADKYYVVSVSESDLDRVRSYIRGQKEHHKKTTFLSEFKKILRDAGFSEEEG